MFGTQTHTHTHNHAHTEPTEYRCKASFQGNPEKFEASIKKNEIVKVLDKQDSGKREPSCNAMSINVSWPHPHPPLTPPHVIQPIAHYTDAAQHVHVMHIIFMNMYECFCLS